MSRAEIPLSALLGRKVRGADGRYIGRLVEMEARIELQADRSDYVVHTYHVSHFGFFDWIAGSVLVQQLVERMGERVGYRCMHVAAKYLDITTSELQLKHQTSESESESDV